MPRPRQYEVPDSELIPFHEAANVKRIGSHEYTGDIHAEYSYGAVAHGGYLISLMWLAIELHFKTTHASIAQPDINAFHIEFLRPVSVGPVMISIKDVRLGKTSSTVHASLSQAGKERCVVYSTNSGPAATRTTISMPMDHRPQPLPPPINFDNVLIGSDPSWIRYDHPQDLALPNATLRRLIYAVQRHPPPNRNIVHQWITPRRSSEKWTNASLGILLDSSVPPMENFYDDAPHNYFNGAKRAMQLEAENRSLYDHPPWLVPRMYPTVNMSVQIKRQLPEEGEKWLSLRWHTKECLHGRFDVDIEVWDVKNNLIATGFSIWTIADNSRSLSTRLSKEREQANKL
ncbi:unnamed protein product [Zymoseptoria tritici ST99CH_1A5]|uniref:Thioesterase domain-containing protein n=1 Tax=Zymoseptoria tritici ST99CH_1A5 TaxID=1276529 RepID=A0A1Y6LDA3_ZYMTR|nr:unnamed protein product [Zymoseptoria tritici ST99CH_1A5]